MFFWLRELTGWALLILGLFLLRLGIAYISNAEEPQIIEGGVVIFASGTVLRIAVLLIRVSTAARICLNERKTKVQ